MYGRVFLAIKPSFQPRYFRRMNNPNVHLMDSSPLQYRSSTVYRDNRRGLGRYIPRNVGETRCRRERRRSSRKWLRHRNRRTRDGDEGREENKCDALHRGGQSRKCLCKSEQLARCAHQFKRTVRLSLPHPPSPPLLSTLPFFSSSSSAFVWSSTARDPHPRFPPFSTNEAVQSHRRRVAFNGKGNDGEDKRKRKGGNAVTRENPLKNVFGRLVRHDTTCKVGRA